MRVPRHFLLMVFGYAVGLALANVAVAATGPVLRIVEGNIADLEGPDAWKPARTRPQAAP